MKCIKLLERMQIFNCCTIMCVSGMQIQVDACRDKRDRQNFKIAFVEFYTKIDDLSISTSMIYVHKSVQNT